MSKKFTGYELSRNWFDFSFENPELIRPIHTALYFFAIEHCNRLGKKEKFGFPSQMAMDALGVKNWRTYSKTLNDLIEWNFIKLIEKASNQYSSNIIAIVNNTKATSKALDNAMLKHNQKQGQSIVSIDKHKNIRTEEHNNIEFDVFWDLYDKKKGNKPKCLKKWNNLKDDVRQKIIDTLPSFKKEISDKQFQPYPEVYLNNERWNDELDERSKKELSQQEKKEANLKELLRVGKINQEKHYGK